MSEPIRVIDHRPQAWYLLEGHDGELLFDARYSTSSWTDATALIVLDDEEVQQYQEQGHDWLSSLQQTISRSLQSGPDSPWRARDLKHSDDPRWRETEAVIDEFLAGPQ